MKISVLGCGRWGTFISWYLSTHKHSVCQWGRENSSSFIEISNSRKNDYVTLGENIYFTSDLESNIYFRRNYNFD